MKLIALVTLVTAGGEIPPGGELEIKDKSDAESLIDRGFARAAETKSKAQSAQVSEPAAASEKTD